MLLDCGFVCEGLRSDLSRDSPTDVISCTLSSASPQCLYLLRLQRAIVANVSLENGVCKHNATPASSMTKKSHRACLIYMHLKMLKK